MGYLTRLTEIPDIEKCYGRDINLREGNTLFELLTFTKHLVCYYDSYKSTMFVLNIHPDIDKKWTKFPGQFSLKGRP